MPNISGPTQWKKKVIAAVAYPTMLYGAVTWADGTRHKYYRQMLESLNRRIAIRVTSAYRTVSTAAVFAISGVPPIDLRIKEKLLVYTKGKEFRAQARQEIMDEWQNRWSQYEGLTKMNIKDIRIWNNRKWDEVNYYLTQAMTGHGVFGKFLHRIGKRETAECWYCGKVDDAVHTIFRCQRWEVERSKGPVQIRQDSKSKVMTDTQEGYKTVTEVISGIMGKKAKEEPRAK